MVRTGQRRESAPLIRLACVCLASGLALSGPALAQGASPPLAAARQHDVGYEDLMSLKDLKGLYVSPDGRFAATLQNQPDAARNTYDFHWVLVPLGEGGAAAAAAGDGGDPLYFDSRMRIDGTLGHYYSTPALWAPDSHAFAYLRQSAGQVQVWATRLDDLRQSQLTHNAADVENFVWREDGQAILFSTAAPRAVMAELRERQNHDGFLVSFDTDWNYDLARPNLDRYAPVGGRPVIWVLDLATGAERMATAEEAGEYRRLVRERDLVRESAGAGLAPVSMPLMDPRFTRADPPHSLRVAGETKGCAAFACSGVFVPVADGSARAWSWWVGRDLYLLRRNGYNAAGVTLWRWPVGGRAKAVLASDDDLTDCTLAARSLVCLLQTPIWPRRVVRVDLANGRISTVFDPNPGWGAVRLGESRWVRFSGPAGRETYGVLTKPIGFKPGGRYPMVVIGYGVEDALRGDSSKRYPAQVLAARGFVTLVYHIWRDENLYYRPDFLARMYGGDAPDGKVSYQQIAAYVDQLSSEGTIDPSRVGIGVFSEGLNTAAWGLLHGDLFRTVATGWVRWNQSEYFHPRNPWYEILESADLLRDPARPPGKIQQEISLSLHVAQVRAPILVNASGLELDHLKQWEPLRRFADAGRPLEMHVAPGEEHVVFEPAHRLIDWRRNVQWFEYWLQDRIDSDPVDPDQYKRWDKMKAGLVHIRGG